MTYCLQEIADLVGGSIPAGNAAVQISGVASLAEAQPSDVSFFANPKYLAELKETQAGAVFIRPDVTVETSAVLILVENPSTAFTILLEKFRPHPTPQAAGIHPSSVIGEGCEIDPSASIQALVVVESGVKIGARTVVGAHSYIGQGTSLGEDCVIYPNVTIRERAQIGRRVIIHSGAVIGSDGYGFELVDGRHQKIPQIGIVQLDDNVEIGANTAIDRARFGRTWIGEGTKIDNLVQIGHNVVVGKHCLIISQVGISGSTQIGNYVIIAGGAGIVGHIKIGDQAIIAAKAGISKNIPAGTKWMGYYAEPAKEMAEKLAYVSRLPKLFSRVKALESRAENPSLKEPPHEVS